MNKEKRCDEFQACLGSGKNIYQLEQEGMFIDEELQAREQKQIKKKLQKQGLFIEDSAIPIFCQLIRLWGSQIYIVCNYYFKSNHNINVEDLIKLKEELNFYRFGVDSLW